MKKALIWFAGFFEDQAGTASSKRVVVYVALLMMFQQVQGSLAGKSINDTVFYGTIATIFATLGLTIPEWFSPKGAMLGGAKIETTSTTTTKDTSVKTEPEKQAV
jgi:amino acid permease